MSEIIYCDGCGKRIREGDEKAVVEGKSFCGACKARTPASTAHNPIPADITARSAQPGRGASQAKIAPQARRATAISGKPQKGDAPANGDNSKTVYLAIGAGTLVLLVAMFMVLGKSEPAGARKQAAAAEVRAPNPSTPSPEAKLTNATQSAERASAAKPPEPVAAKTIPEEPAPTIEDIREGYARRKLDDAVAQEKAKGMTTGAFRKELEGLVGSHGSTKAGKEAAELLKKLPAAAPVASPEPAKTVAGNDSPKTAANGPYTTLYRWSAEAGGDTAGFSSGRKDEKDAPEGKPFSWQSAPFDGGWFTLKTTLGFQDKNVKIGKDTWIRIHCKVDSAVQLCFHSAMGDQMTEKFLGDLPHDKWTWLGFKVSDCTKDIRTGAAPKSCEGSQWQGSTIYGHSNSKPNTIWIDEVVIGDGPMPAP